MSFKLLTAASAAILASMSNAQDESKYTVWSSVVFSRTGERTPATLGDIPTQLTPLGAQQMFGMGSFFRERYVTSMGSTDGIDSAPISGLSAYTPDLTQIYVFSLDMQYTLASAQAFMQGFYPPVMYNETSSDSDTEKLLNPFGVLANGSFIDGPLNGMQYTQIQAVGGYDPEYPYIGAYLECQAWDEANLLYLSSDQFNTAQADSSSIYQTIGPALLADVMPPYQWGYTNAYAIYDYISYLYQHNASVVQLFNESYYIDDDTRINYIDVLRWYADKQQYAQLGNLNAVNNVTSQPFPEGVSGSISTLSGNMLAAKMVALLGENIVTEGEYNKFNLLVGDFQPLVSFFSLMGLPDLNPNFYGLPQYASVGVFELYTKSDASDGTAYPSEDDMWVRFYFKNGTDDSEQYLAYPLFGLGPDQFEMTWGDFLSSMNSYMIGDIGFWCQQCGPEITDSTRVFCSYWNTSDSLAGASLPDSSSHHAVSPAIGGLIGAIVSLVVAGIIFGAMMLIGGVRFHRVPSRKSELGGFKGSQKLASDKDLTLPKGGAVVGATVETPGSPVHGGHERVGSWELKQHDLPNIAATHPARRPSFEEDDVGEDIAYRKPVKPDERV